MKRIYWILLIIGTLAFTRTAVAHPMGNFSVNHYAKITVQNSGVKLQYIIDLAEIPTYQELQQGNITANADSSATIRYAASRGTELSQGIRLTVDDKPLTLHLKSSGMIFPPGAGGLPTMKMGFVYEAAYPTGIDRTHARLHYADSNYPGHTGWKEVIATVSSGSLLKSSVPTTDRSAELSNYPTDLLSSPPQSLEASLEFTVPPPPASTPTAPLQASAARQRDERPPTRSYALNKKTGPVASSPLPAQVIPLKPLSNSVATEIPLRANEQKTPRSSFTELITAQRLSPWFLFTAAFIAIGLGALHALEPGHGKTIVAAYLVGSRGTPSHALLLGLIVTISHTAGVFALGGITLWASRYVVPEQLYPWLGVLSGISIAGLGLYMLLRRLTGTATDHDHTAGTSHGLWPFSKRSEDSGSKELQRSSRQSSAKSVGLAQLFTLGITGGIIPCPAALIVLLSAFALHRIALGFFLIVAFSIGLAAVLIGFGMMMVYARRFMTLLHIDGPITRKWLPAASAAFIALLGVAIAVQAFATTQLNLDYHLFSKERLGPFLFVVGLGLLLGMRHSTDADHVVAISTIVTRQKSIRHAAFIGSVWGLGHTITIFIVGALIILFGVVIPPRVGLSMEFSVAIMLILLGIFNLTGVTQKLSSRFTPAPVDTANDLPNKILPDSLGRWNRYIEQPVNTFGLYQCVRPLVIGLVHGLAGSAAVALLVLSTIHNPLWATFYLLIFGAGTLVGMMFMTAAMAVPLTYASGRFTHLGRYLGLASGMVSLCFGCFLVYQLGFVSGLFTTHPHWTPQ